MMNRVKFLGVATDINGQPTGTIWRMTDEGQHMTTLVIPNQRLDQLLAAQLDQPISRPLSLSKGSKSALPEQEPSQ